MLGFLGVIFITKPPFILKIFESNTEELNQEGRYYGIALCFASAIFYALESIICRKGEDVDNMALTHYLGVFGVLMFSWYKNFEYPKTLTLADYVLCIGMASVATIG